MALSGSKRAAAARSLLTSNERKLAANAPYCVVCMGADERATRNPRLDRQQMNSGQVWPVGRWSEVMLDQLLRSLSG